MSLSALIKIAPQQRWPKVTACLVAAITCFLVPVALHVVLSGTKASVNLIQTVSAAERDLDLLKMAEQVDPARRDQAIKDIIGLATYAEFQQRVSHARSVAMIAALRTEMHEQATGLDATSYVGWVPIPIGWLLIVLGIGFAQKKSGNSETKAQTA